MGGMDQPRKLLIPTAGTLDRSHTLSVSWRAKARHPRLAVLGSTKSPIPPRGGAEGGKREGRKKIHVLFFKPVQFPRQGARDRGAVENAPALRVAAQAFRLLAVLEGFRGGVGVAAADGRDVGVRLDGNVETRHRGVMGGDGLEGEPLFDGVARFEGVEEVAGDLDPRDAVRFAFVVIPGGG